MPSKGRRFFRSVFWINRCSVDTKSRIIVNNSPSDSTAFAKILSSPLAAVNSTSWLPVTYADYLQQIALPLHAFLVTDVSSYLHLLGADVAYWWVIISVSDIIVWSKPQQSFEYGAQFAFYCISSTPYEKPLYMEEFKEEAYWERQRKNKEAAKRSRDTRRAKKTRLPSVTAFLEHENLMLNAWTSLWVGQFGNLRRLEFIVRNYIVKPRLK